MDNKKNLKQQILKELFTFLSQSKFVKTVNFKGFNKVSIIEKYRCLILSKNLSNYLKNNKIIPINNKSLINIITKHAKPNNLKIYKKNIELIKFYTLLFTDKNCSHLATYLFKNLNISSLDKKNYLSITIYKDPKHSIILNENLDISTKKNFKKPLGEIFINQEERTILKDVKHKALLFVFSIIVTYILIYNIPSNRVIMEMNSTMHIKMNHNGNIISCKPKNSSAKNIIKNTKQLNKKLNVAIPHFINYGLENDLIHPGEKVKIYVIGPPLNHKFSENLKNSLQNIPLNITINNSGNLIKINRT